MDIRDLVSQCMGEIQKRIADLEVINIMTVGKSGVGKSTLINAVFRENLADTGIGKPVTQRMSKYTKKGFPLGIYDTRGFELGKDAQQDVKKEILDTIKAGVKSCDKNQAIHCIWYCINVSSNRFEQEEVNWLKEFTGQNDYNVPVIIVLTQAFSEKKAQEMKKVIEAENLDVKKVVPVLAQDYEVDDEYLKKAYGMDNLIEVMQEVMPDNLIDTLMHVQQVNLSKKQEKSQAAVVTAAASAAVAGASPIPFSDAAVLVPIEATMLASITVIFGFEINKSILTSLISTVIGAGGATIGGKTIASNLLKMIPGVGTVAGAAISGSTASILTVTLGEAYIGIMTMMFNGEIKESELGTKTGRKKFMQMFEKQLGKNKLKN